MNALIRKEIRLAAPAWMAAVALVVIGTWIAPRWIFSSEGREAAARWCFCLGAMLISLSIFGQEFNLGTFSQLLSQPAQRSRIWKAKMNVVGLALLSILFVFCLGWKTGGIDSMTPPRGRWMTALVPAAYGTVIAVVACASALWTTLLLRQVTAAFWFALGIPGIIAYSVARVFESRWGQDLQYYETVTILVTLLAYAAVSFLMARKLFFSAQDTQWTGGNIQIPIFGRKLLSIIFFRRGAVSALIHKEIQLHIVPLFMALALLIASSAVIVLDRILPRMSESVRFMSGILIIILWFSIPFIVGGSALSEERKMNTLEGQLCLPCSRRIQFAIKFAVALLIGVVMGGVLPALVSQMGQHLLRIKEPLWSTVCVFSTISAIITIITFYASTLTRNILQAIGMTIAVAGGCFLLIFATLQLVLRFFCNPAFGLELPIYLFIGLPILGFLLLWLAYGNFSRPRMDRAGWATNIFAIAVVWVIFLTVSAGVYFRSWEFFMPLEPQHNPARGTGAADAKLCLGGKLDCLFVLLPDGRLWAANKFQFEGTCEEGVQAKNNFQLVSQIPLSGGFLDQSNWASVTDNYRAICGLKFDGTLWSIAAPPFKWPSGRPTFTQTIGTWNIKQIGTDTDWRAICAGSTHFLGLKRDGTLLGWGNNDNGQLGTATNSVESPIRIGTDSDWVSIFAQAETSFGVKSDGSVWGWGDIIWPSGALKSKARHPEPVRLALTGTNWVAIAIVRNHLLGLRNDGTLFAAGEKKEKIFGCVAQGENNSLSQQIGSGWRSVSTDYSGDVGLKNSGAFLIENNWNLFRTPSKYHDWTAASPRWGSVVALAADGTLCCWSTEANENFCASRRALWSLNIFK